MTSKQNFQLGDKRILERAIRELNIESFEEDVEKIKAWMGQQPHLPETMDDNKIRNFLLLSKGSLELAKQKIDNYYTIRSQLPEVFDEINPKYPYLDNFMNTCYSVASSTLTKEMYRVIFIKTRSRSLMEKLDPIEALRYFVNSQEIRLLEDVMVGDVFVLDGDGLPLKAVLNLTPAIVYKSIVLVYERVFASRMKAVYFLNSPPFLDVLLSLIKTVMKPKLFQRIHVLKDVEDLFEHVGKEVVPCDYGGEEKSLDAMQDDLRAKFRKYQMQFDKLDQLRVDESLRPEKLKNDEMLGFYGNFKNLQVD